MNIQVSEAQTDPLFTDGNCPLTATFGLMGFRVRVETNRAEVLTAAAESWADDFVAGGSLILLRIVVTQGPDFHPVPTTIRLNDALLSIIADGDNFVVCDLEQSSAHGWMTESALGQREYVRYHLMEAAAMCLLSSAHVTALHAACVSFMGSGFLFCGESGAGKTTLAYACAEAGWTFTSDDASYLLWHSSEVKVRGNHHQVRFRPSAARLFADIGDRPITKRTEGKPSIEIPTSELNIHTAEEARIDNIIFLDRQNVDGFDLAPLRSEEVLPYFHLSLFASGALRDRQVKALRTLEKAKAFRMTYRDLDAAIHCLESLAAQR